jgi:hypothetical protein
MTVVNAAAPMKTVADPNSEYESLKMAWLKSRAFCSGQDYVKAFDGRLDTINFQNILIPFSPTMTEQQYTFYKAEAELPGIIAEFSKMIVGGLLRKNPTVKLPPGLPPEATDWIVNSFNKDDTPLMSFLDSALSEEIQTSRAWVLVDYPSADKDNVPEDVKDSLKPYPTILAAENIINWKYSETEFGKSRLEKVIVRGYEEVEDPDNEFHPKLVDTVYVHELVDDKYQIRVFQMTTDRADVSVVSGQRIQKTDPIKPVLKETITDIMIEGKQLDFIPAWPLNGKVAAVTPMLMALIDKEAAIYNKISRRNHLLYGAATYTPVIISDITDEQFDAIVRKGLGSWLQLPVGSDAKILDTPTAALADMDRAIAAAIEEMAKLGIRMLTPETNQSGVALDIRNAAQTAKLGSLSAKISSTMQQIIAFMLSWRYGVEVKASDVIFKLSEDFSPLAVGDTWMTLATEWYQAALIPRSVWIQLLKQNDMLPSDYDDEKGKLEITADQDAVMAKQAEASYADQLQNQGA